MKPKLQGRLRLIAALGIVVAGALLVDLAIGWRFLDADRRYRGQRVPPFGALDAELEARVRTRLDELDHGVRPVVFRAFDPELGWTNRPGRSGRAPETSFNSIGARGRREYARERPPGVLRVAVYGESSALGSDVADHECWTALLEAADSELELLNLAVAAYGTDQALLRFRREGRHDAQVVMLGLMTENVCRNVNRYRPLYAPDERGPAAKPRFTLDPSGELELLPLPWTDEASFLCDVFDGRAQSALAASEFWAGDAPVVPFSRLARVLACVRAYARRDPARYWLDPPSEPYQVTRALVRTFHREALAAGAERFVLIVFASPRDYELSERTGVPHWQPLLAELAAEGIEVLDLASAFATDWRDPDVFTGSHLGLEGNRRAAERVRAALR